jgi:hypothetical protein
MGLAYHAVGRLTAPEAEEPETYFITARGVILLQGKLIRAIIITRYATGH